MSEPTPNGALPDHASENGRRSRHERAVANTLSWADQAAAAGQFGDALAWLQMLDAIGASLPEPYIAKRSVWVHALGAGTEMFGRRRRLLSDEPRATKRMLALSQGLATASDMPVLLDGALEGATEILNTNLGNIQIRDPASGALTIAASCGFESEFLEYFTVVADDSSACGRAARQRAQTVIVDVNEDPGFAPHREIAAASRFRAVQSTPIVDPAGQLQGVISTHFRDRHHPSRHQMQLIEWYSERIGAALAGCLAA